MLFIKNVSSKVGVIRDRISIMLDKHVWILCK